MWLPTCSLAYDSEGTNKSKAVPNTPLSKTIATMYSSSSGFVNSTIDPQGKLLDEATILTVP